MEKLGFGLPETIREISLQKERLYKDRENIENMINKYNKIIEDFDDADVSKQKINFLKLLIN